MTYLVAGEDPPPTDMWGPETIGVRRRGNVRDRTGHPLRTNDYRGHPLRTNDYRGLVDGELVVVPPGVTPTGRCGDCGMDDGLVGWARLCRWCADLRVIKADQPPPNPGRQVRS